MDVVILSLNEEANIGRCLRSVSGLAQRTFVVDSGSCDRTGEIVRTEGATLTFHSFESHSRQWQWALESLPFESEWVLGLDADQEVSTELAHDIRRFISCPGEAVGAFVARRQVFRGRWIRHGGYYPKYLLKLFRRDQVRVDERDLVDHHFYVDGQKAVLAGDLIESNENENCIAAWIAKHNRYAQLQAAEECGRHDEASREGSPFGDPDERTRWMKTIWRMLPLYLRPFVYFSYRYFVRLGFLDGKQGFIFHFLQAFWYRLLVDINIDEIRGRRTSAN